MSAITLTGIERDEFFDLAGDQTEIVCLNADGLRVLIATADRGFGRALFVRGARPDTKLLGGAIRYLDRVGQRPSGLFVDVGANIGTATLAAIKHHQFARAVAIEPEPTNAALIAASAGLNGMADRVQVVNVAALDHGRGGLLRLVRGDSSTHAISFDGDLPVRTRTLDSLNLGEVGMLWLDVEGSEGQVLRGARKLLRSRPPIVLEFNPRWLAEHDGLDEVLRVASAYRECVHPKTHEPLNLERLAVELDGARGKHSRHTDALLVP